VTEDEIKFLKDHDHQTVLLHLKDGEVVKAKILFVSETEQDVIVDLISSTNIARYQRTMFNRLTSIYSKTSNRLSPILKKGLKGLATPHHPLQPRRPSDDGSAISKTCIV